MLTPFEADLSIDLVAVRAYATWLIEQGSAGLFPVALSGEMFDLDEAERLAIVRCVVEAAAGRVPVIAAIAETTDPSASVARMAATGVDAVVLIASVVVGEHEDEGVMIDEVERILAENPGIDLGIYECPLPTHRLLSTETIVHLARTGRFVFFKETSHDVDRMAERVAAVRGTRLKIFAAGIETLSESIAVGVSGLSGWVVTAFPDAVARLCVSGDAAEQERLTAIEQAIGPTYPSSAKYLVARRSGIEMHPISRWRPAQIDPGSLDELLG